MWHLADTWAALGLGCVDVVGHSLGGWFAAELALRRPDLVAPSGAGVARSGCTCPGLDIPPFFGAVAPRGIGGAGEARRLLFADPDGAPALSALPDVMTTEQQLQWFGGLAGAARLGWKAPHFQSRKLTARLRRISVDTLVLRGAHDASCPPPPAGRGPTACLRRRLVEVPGAGHCVALETPDTADDVEGFLGVEDGRRGGGVELDGLSGPGHRRRQRHRRRHRGPAPRRRGARVAVLDIAEHRRRRRAPSRRRTGPGPDPSVLAVGCDVTNEDEVIGAVGRVADAFGGIDVAVLNAGVGGFGAVMELTSEEWDRVLGINLRGTFLCLREVGQGHGVERAGRGHRGRGLGVGLPRRPHDGATTACPRPAWPQLVRVAAPRARALRDPVNAVAPGTTDTPCSPPRRACPDIGSGWRSAAPWAGWGRGRGVAHAVVALLQLEWVTGQVLAADGGVSLWSPIDPAESMGTEGRPASITAPSRRATSTPASASIADGIGLEVLMDQRLRRRLAHAVRRRSTTLRSVFLGDPDPDAGIVELVDFGAAPGPVPAVAGRGRRAFFLLSFSVDLGATLARLASLGSPEVRRIAQPAPGGAVAMATVRDPDGVLVELIDTGARARCPGRLRARCAAIRVCS